MSERKLWLIDAGYFFNAQNSLYGDFKLDYLKLRQKLESYGPVWRAYYLNSMPYPSSDQQDAFHNWLQCGPPRGPKIITRLYGLKRTTIDFVHCEQCRERVEVSCAKGGHRLYKEQQKGVDVGLVTLALTHQENYDTLVLSSGDGDLLDAVEYLTERGKHLELLVFKAGVSTDLQARADTIRWIDDFADQVAR
jgi:uncharacterized LabA/DUF88 family protein